MNMRNIKFAVPLLAGCLFSGATYALALNDAGVVGTIEAGTQNSSVANEIAWANYLLSLPANTSQTVDAPGDTQNATENYQTSSTDYNGLLSGGVQLGAGSNISGYEWVMGKYDGQNAGYVLFNVAALGAATIPLSSASIWVNNQQQGYGLSHITAWGGTPVPEPTTLLLLSIGLVGVGVTSWKKKDKATGVA